MLDTKGVGDSEEDPTVAYQTFVPEFEDSLYYSDSGETAEDLPSEEKLDLLQILIISYLSPPSSICDLWGDVLGIDVVKETVWNTLWEN